MSADVPSPFLIAWQALRGFFDLWRLLRREPFDLLHAHMRGTFLVGRWAARWLRRTVVFTNHTYARRIVMYRRAAGQRRFHTVLLTPNMARYYQLEADPPKINVISACCADSYFKGPMTPRRTTPATTREPLRLVGVGNIVAWKNWHRVLEAIGQLAPDEREKVQFRHYGPTPGQADPHTYARQLAQAANDPRVRDRVRFCGPTQGIGEALAEADWFVLPSTNEPCSVALMEALALGVPVLVSASGGNIDIVTEGKSGVFFKPDDSHDLSLKIQSILAFEQDLWPESRIRDSVRPRSATEVGRQYLELYRQVTRVGTQVP